MNKWYGQRLPLEGIFGRWTIDWFLWLPIKTMFVGDFPVSDWGWHCLVVPAALSRTHALLLYRSNYAMALATAKSDSVQESAVRLGAGKRFIGRLWAILTSPLWFEEKNIAKLQTSKSTVDGFSWFIYESLVSLSRFSGSNDTKLIRLLFLTCSPALCGAWPPWRSRPTLGEGSYGMI